MLGNGLQFGSDPRKQSAGGEWNRTEEPTQELSLSWELITTRFPKVPLRNHEDTSQNDFRLPLGRTGRTGELSYRLLSPKDTPRSTDFPLTFIGKSGKPNTQRSSF